MTYKYKLDPEEQEILHAIEEGEWKHKKLSPSEMNRYIKIARNTLRKGKRINIRISSTDLEGLKTKAIREGLPYQTLIASVLHKYVTGQIHPAHP